jgi:hypothetical protein
LAMRAAMSIMVSSIASRTYCWGITDTETSVARRLSASGFRCP